MGFGTIFLISWTALAIFAFWKKQTVIISLLGTFICALLIAAVLAPKESPHVQQLTPEQTANIQLNADSDAAKIRAKEYAEASLKAPSTAKWADYSEFETARARDKKGQVIKDVWDVALHVDAQNSYGAMIRTKFLVTVKKTSEDWKLVNISTF